MFELRQVGKNSYYIESPAKIGLVRTGGSDVVLIDSGSDKDAGRRVRKLLGEQGWTLRAIYNTHSNADHIGGNAYLQAQTGCRIYAPGIERAFTEFPILEPAFLYGGFPPDELRHKFLLAQSSAAEPLTPEALPDGLEMIPLPGHFFDMAGFRTQDGVVYLADCLSSGQTLEKYRIGFIYDVAAYLDTLERVKAMQAALFVPAHAAETAEIAPLAQRNIDAVHSVADTVCALCAQPVSFEQLLARLFAHYGLTMTFEQYALVGSTVRSYLAWLKAQGRLTARFADNLLLWQRAET